jgi:hypothetical protein
MSKIFSQSWANNSVVGRYFEIPCKLYCPVRVCRYTKNLDIGVHIFVRYLPASLKVLGREINTANTYLGLIRSMF